MFKKKNSSWRVALRYVRNLYNRQKPQSEKVNTTTLMVTETHTASCDSVETLISPARDLPHMIYPLTLPCPLVLAQLN